jgi:glucose/mannose transport system permease protein
MSATDLVTSASTRRRPGHSTTTRIVIYGLLGLFAFVYLVWLVVMVMTSLKPLDEVTGGNMFALPRHLTFEPWSMAWGEARIGVSETRGINGYFSIR